MLKKSITYTDFNGVERTEDFYFNLTKAELAEMELSTAGGLSEMIQRVVATNDVPTMIKIFKDIIMKSFDGKRFMKSEEISNAFVQTEAYSVLFMEMVTDVDAASKFLNGVIPAVPQQPTFAPVN